IGIVAQAKRLLDAPLVVHSYSSTLVAAVAAAGVEVTCGRSEPGGEGEATARALRERGVDAAVVDDEEALDAVAGRILVVGADAVGPGGGVNKIKTRLLAEAARRHKERAYVLAGSTKLIGVDLPADGSFERTPTDLFTAIVTEEGPVRSVELEQLLPALKLHPTLAGLLSV
ncbi:MAG: hypothetical protein ACRDH6_09160, partial [Actinomycetota bacterium]